MAVPELVMPPRASTRGIVAIAAIIAAWPVSAQQIYKWVDERGVTNYSNQPPTDPKTAQKARPVEDRLSVYSPDPGLKQAIEDLHKNVEERQNRRRIEQLEDQLAAERRARCLADGRLDCGEIYGIYPYHVPVVVGPHHPKHKRKHFSGPTLKPGTIAGNVTADNNFIPGNSASAEPIRRGPTGRKSTDGRMTRVAPSERAVPARR